MLEALFWVSVGLVVGWNVLPQPTWVENLYKNISDKLTNSEEK